MKGCIRGIKIKSLVLSSIMLAMFILLFVAMLPQPASADTVLDYVNQDFYKPVEIDPDMAH